MKKILITGADVFLASRFIQYYKNTFDITAMNRKALDITNEKDILEHFRHHNYDTVFHFAALSDTGFCEHNPDLAHQVNTQGTTFIAKGCSLSNTTLVFASSDQVYNGNIESGPYTESTFITPNSIYAHTKLDAENTIKALLPNYYNLRLPWLFCLHERHTKTNTNILTNLLQAMHYNTPISLATNEYRSMTYVYDIITNLHPLLSLPYGDYNFGSENNTSTYEIGTFILETLGLHHRIPEILIQDTLRFAEHPRDLRISISKLQKNGISFPTTKEGIIKCLKDFRVLG